MTTIVTILTEGFADWETTMLNAVGHSFYKITTRFATPDGQPVTSAGGMHVTPDMAMNDIDPATTGALVICGGGIWVKQEAPDISAIARAFHAAGKPVGGICDGTLALARTGLLDTVRHTSNSPDNLPKSGYAGASHYVDQPTAIADDNIITAPATAPVHFMAKMLEALGLRDKQLDYYIGLHAAEHSVAA